VVKVPHAKIPLIESYKKVDAAQKKITNQHAKC
jgi:hypothetical protein